MVAELAALVADVDALDAEEAAAVALLAAAVAEVAESVALLAASRACCVTALRVASSFASPVPPVPRYIAHLG